MYAIRIGMEARLRPNRELREYARLEYGHDEVGWILAGARKARTTTPRPRFSLRHVRAPRPAPHPAVACKGTPRRQPLDARTPA